MTIYFDRCNFYNHVCLYLFTSRSYSIIFNRFCFSIIFIVSLVFIFPSQHEHVHTTQTIRTALSYYVVLPPQYEICTNVVHLFKRAVSRSENNRVHYPRIHKLPESELPGVYVQATEKLRNVIEYMLDYLDPRTGIFARVAERKS